MDTCTCLSGRSMWQCAQGTQCLCVCATRECACMWVHAFPYASVSGVCLHPCESRCFLLQVGGTSTSFSRACSLSMTCSLPFCFLQPPNPSPIFRSPSKDLSSNWASALTFSSFQHSRPRRCLEHNKRVILAGCFRLLHLLVCKVDTKLTDTHVHPRTWCIRH